MSIILLSLSLKNSVMKNKTLIPLIFLMLFGVLSAQNKELVGSYKGRGGGIFLYICTLWLYDDSARDL